MDLEQGQINFALFLVSETKLFKLFLNCFLFLSRKSTFSFGFCCSHCQQTIFSTCSTFLVPHGLQNMLDVKNFFLEKLKSPKLLKIGKNYKHHFCNTKQFLYSFKWKWKFQHLLTIQLKFIAVLAAQLSNIMAKLEPYHEIFVASKIRSTGNFLMVQWLDLGAFSAVAWV